MSSFFSPDHPEFSMDQQIRDDELSRVVDQITSDMRAIESALAETEWRAQTAFFVAILAIIFAAMAFGKAVL